MNTGIKSNLFLAGSCIAAISAVGSVFELASGQPDFGPGPTAGILVVAAPLTVWFFLSAVSEARSKQK
jgi:hypothetical protein